MSTATKSRRRLDDEEEEFDEEEDVQAVKGNVIHTFVKLILITVTIVELSFTAVTG